MKKQLSLLLSVVSIIFLLFLLVAVSLIILINPNDFKPKLSASVRKHTNYQLSFNGDIQWSSFPWFNLNLPEVVISNPHYFSEQPLAKADKIILYIKLLSLFRAQIEIKRIDLYGVNAHSLEIDALTVSEFKTDLSTTPYQMQISGRLSSPLLRLASRSNIGDITQFDNLNTRFTLHNKVLRLENLRVRNRDLYLTGKGFLDLNSQQLYYTLEEDSKNNKALEQQAQFSKGVE